MTKFLNSKLPVALIEMDVLFEILSLEIYLFFEVCHLEINEEIGKYGFVKHKIRFQTDLVK